CVDVDEIAFAPREKRRTLMSASWRRSEQGEPGRPLSKRRRYFTLDGSRRKVFQNEHSNIRSNMHSMDRNNSNRTKMIGCWLVVALVRLALGCAPSWVQSSLVGLRGRERGSPKATLALFHLKVDEPAHLVPHLVASRGEW